jgi:hypothetical protein
MPTLSASDYTTFLKFKAAAATPIQRSIQTSDNVTLSQSVLNANILASQAAFTVTPTLQVIGDNARVVGLPVVQTRANPEAKSTLSWTSGTSGSVGSLSSSRVNVPGGLPTGFKNSQGTYTRIPQNAGWIQGGAGTVSSGPKRF